MSAGTSCSSTARTMPSALAKAIDDMFANSPYETKTETESAFAAGWVKQFGNIEFLILTIGTVVFFTLLLVTGNTMAISVRERTGELARLQGHRIFRSLCAVSSSWRKSLVIALVGGFLGLGACRAGHAGSGCGAERPASRR